MPGPRDDGGGESTEQTLLRGQSLRRPLWQVGGILESQLLDR